jgi:hypothetical protein
MTSDVGEIPNAKGANAKEWSKIKRVKEGDGWRTARSECALHLGDEPRPAGRRPPHAGRVCFPDRFGVFGGK